MLRSRNTGAWWHDPSQRNNSARRHAEVLNGTIAGRTVRSVRHARAAFGLRHKPANPGPCPKAGGACLRCRAQPRPAPAAADLQHCSRALGQACIKRLEEAAEPLARVVGAGVLRADEMRSRGKARHPALQVDKWRKRLRCAPVLVLCRCGTAGRGACGWASCNGSFGLPLGPAILENSDTFSKSQNTLAGSPASTGQPAPSTGQARCSPSGTAVQTGAAPRPIAGSQAPRCPAAGGRWPHRIAQPLHSRDGDGAVDHAGSDGQAVPQVMQAQVTLHLPLSRHIQHRLADVQALVQGTAEW